MIMTEITELKPKEIKAEGRPKRITLKFSPLISEAVKLLSEEYGSYKGVIEQACRLFIYENEPKEGKPWSYTFQLPKDIQKGLEERMPYYASNTSMCIRLALLELILRKQT